MSIYLMNIYEGLQMDYKMLTVDPYFKTGRANNLRTVLNIETMISCTGFTPFIKPRNYCSKICKTN